jgi:hypothetical protein
MDWQIRMGLGESSFHFRRPRPGPCHSEPNHKNGGNVEKLSIFFQGPHKALSRFFRGRTITCQFTDLKAIPSDTSCPSVWSLGRSVSSGMYMAL